MSWGILMVWQVSAPRASSYDIARITKTPVILIVDCKGASLSDRGLDQGISGIWSGADDSGGDLKQDFTRSWQSG